MAKCWSGCLVPVARWRCVAYSWPSGELLRGDSLPGGVLWVSQPWGCVAHCCAFPVWCWRLAVCNLHGGRGLSGLVSCGSCACVGGLPVAASSVRLGALWGGVPCLFRVPVLVCRVLCDVACPPCVRPAAPVAGLLRGGPGCACWCCIRLPVTGVGVGAGGVVASDFGLAPVHFWAWALATPGGAPGRHCCLACAPVPVVGSACRLPCWSSPCQSWRRGLSAVARLS